MTVPLRCISPFLVPSQKPGVFDRSIKQGTVPRSCTLFLVLLSLLSCLPRLWPHSRPPGAQVILSGAAESCTGETRKSPVSSHKATRGNEAAPSF